MADETSLFPPPPDAVERTPLRSWWILFVLQLLYILSFIDRNMLGVLVESITTDLRITDVQFSLLVGGPFAVFYALCAVPLGALADRSSRRLVIAGGLAVWSACTAVGGLASSFGQLLAARTGVAVGEAALLPAANSIIPDVFAKTRLTTATSIFMMGGAIGSSAALIIAGGLLASLTDGALNPLVQATSLRPWQLVFIILGLTGLPLLLLVFTFREPKRRARLLSSSEPTASVWRYLRSNARLYGPLFVGFAAAGMAGYSISHWTPAYLIRAHGMSARDAGVLLGSIMLPCSLLAAPLAGLLADAFLKRGVNDIHYRYYIICAALGGPVLVAALLSGDLLFFSLAFGFAILMLIPHGGLAFSALQLSTPAEHRGKVAALFLMIYNLAGLGLGPLLVASITDFVLQDETQIGVALAATVGLTLTVAVLALSAGRRAFVLRVRTVMALSAPDPRSRTSV